MQLLDLLGIIAGICTTICLVPQATKIHKSKQTNDISLEMYVIFVIGITLWLIYGSFKQDFAVVFANAITLPLALYILLMKIKHR